MMKCDREEMEMTDWQCTLHGAILHIHQGQAAAAAAAALNEIIKCRSIYHNSHITVLKILTFI